MSEITRMRRLNKQTQLRVYALQDKDTSPLGSLDGVVIVSGKVGSYSVSGIVFGFSGEPGELGIEDPLYIGMGGPRFYGNFNNRDNAKKVLGKLKENASEQGYLHSFKNSNSYLYTGSPVDEYLEQLRIPPQDFLPTDSQMNIVNMIAESLPQRLSRLATHLEPISLEEHLSFEVHSSTWGHRVLDLDQLPERLRFPEEGKLLLYYGPHKSGTSQVTETYTRPKIHQVDGGLFNPR